ncbi:PAS domain-containing protein [Candidatus Poribacteria bacterium]|nr:PAS domain-containing protein [Candidatus Poribacteria bacterium]
MLSRATPLLFLAFINFILAGVVYWNNRKQPINKLFAFFICSFVGWTLSLFAIWFTFGKATNLFWGRVVFAPVSIASLCFLWFAEVFPDNNTIVLKKGLVVSTFLGLTTALLSFSSAFVTRLQYVEAGQYRPVLGPLYPLYAFQLLSCFGYAFFILGRKWRKARGFSKLQIQYLFLGVFIFFCSAIINNLIIPPIFNAYQFTIYGPYFVLFFIGFTAHAIIRYRLMDIKAIISRSAVYVLSSAIALAILLGLFFSIRRVLPTEMNIPEEVLIIAIASNSIIVFLPLKRLLNFSIDKYFYRETINLQRAMRDASKVLASVLEQDELLEYLGRRIVQQMKVESVFIFLREKEEDSFRLKLARRYFNNTEIMGLRAKRSNQRQVREAIPSIGALPNIIGTIPSAGETLPTTLSMEKSVVLKEINRRIKNNLPRQEKFLVREELSRQSEDVIAQRICEELTNLRCEVAFPLMSASQNGYSGELIGVLFIGPKLSTDPYFQTDLDLLSMVANQASIAIKNAQLYAQVNRMKEYNENILRNMESGVITVNEAGIVITFNEEAERLTGISREQAIGKEVTALEANISTLILAALHRHELNQHGETTIKTQDNRSIPIVFSTSLLTDKNEEILGSLIVFSDLSQIKQLEEDKRKMERLATMGSIAAGLTHEIKNSLVPIRTFAELLPERYSDPEFRESFCQIVLPQIDEINELVGQMRDLANPPPAKFTSVNIAMPIEDILNLLSGKIEKTGVQVIKDYAHPPLPTLASPPGEGGEAPAIWADESQLRQLFLNLLMNSLQAMPQGGKLYIKTYVQPSFNEQRFMCIEILDTGEGIAQENIKKAFEPFFTTKVGGTGLGLTICRNIVDLHKGTIEIANNETGEGVTVTVRFPIRT